MKRFLLPLGVIAALGLAMFSCVDKLAYEPTYAIPLVDGSLTIGDVVGARPSEIDSLSDGNRTYFQLVYPDTLEPIPFSDFGQGNVPSGVSVTLDEQDVFLRMTGKAGNGTFQFTNPTVEFRFTNTVGLDFDLFLDNTFTRNVATQLDSAFTITDLAWLIPRGSESAPGDTLHTVNNANTDGALSNVFSPSPKFLYYTPRIVTASSGSNIGSGEVGVVATVKLPFEGFATASRQDTLPYAIEDQAVRDAFQENLEFALVRLSFLNELPIQVQLTGYIVDTNRVDPDLGGPLRLADLPLSGQDGASLTNDIVIVGASLDANGQSTATESVLDVNVNNDPIKAAILEGNAILLDYILTTTDYSTNNEVIFYSDQQLDINMGLKFKVSVEQDRQALLDSLGI
jgi:hypothetical protein